MRWLWCFHCRRGCLFRSIPWLRCCLRRYRWSVPAIGFIVFFSVPWYLFALYMLIGLSKKGYWNFAGFSSLRWFVASGWSAYAVGWAPQCWAGSGCWVQAFGKNKFTKKFSFSSKGISGGKLSLMIFLTSSLVRKFLAIKALSTLSINEIGSKGQILKAMM